MLQIKWVSASCCDRVRPSENRANLVPKRYVKYSWIASKNGLNADDSAQKTGLNASGSGQKIAFVKENRTNLVPKRYVKYSRIGSKNGLNAGESAQKTGLNASRSGQKMAFVRRPRWPVQKVIQRNDVFLFFL